MRLRKPCEHGRYDPHGEAYVTRAGGGTYRTYDCPGGEFLAADALADAIETAMPSLWPLQDRQRIARDILDALTVRQREGAG